MKKRIFSITLILALVAVLLAFAGCADDGGGDVDEIDAKPVDFSTLELSRYVTLGDYRGLDIRLQDSSTSRADAVWQAVVSNSAVLEYPTEQIDYYTAQSRAKYEYMAKNGGMTYEQLLEELSVTDEYILAEAQRLTKEDLVFYAIIKAENISVTEAEKAEHFDKYVEKYVSDYGYREEYVRQNLAEEIYDSMLYDKTLEFLISQNTFHVIN